MEKHLSRERIEMEKFLDNQAEPAHDEIKRKLKTYDEKTTSYHQVGEVSPGAIFSVNHT